ncbi:MAG: DNA primase [Thermoplasmata archaeon]|nr:DNA primase [Thermoplasmata archaeon]
MRIEKRLEEVEGLIEQLVHLSDTMAVIVEGRKDERALRELGVKGEIVRLNKGESIFGTCERLSRDHKKVILMTDWDRKGGHLGKLLKDGLEANGVQYDENIRARLAVLTKKDIKDVENLAKQLARLRREAAGGVGGFK